jgi:hypothetical protein
MNTEKPIIVLVPGHRTTSIISGKDCWEIGQLIHITSTGLKSQFYDLPQWLGHDGFEVYLAQYKNGKTETPNIEQLSQWLRDQIETLASHYPHRKIVIIGFSLGGLIVRAYIDSDLYKQTKMKFSREILDSAFLVATPHNGSGMRLFFNILVDFEHAKGQKACCQFSDSTYMSEFNKKYLHNSTDIPLYLIGTFGSKTLKGHLMSAYLWILTGQNNDGGCDIVNATSLPGATQTAIVYGSHARMYGDHCFSNESTIDGRNIYSLCLRPVLVTKDPLGCKGSPHAWRTVPLWAFPLSLLITGVFLPVALLRFWWRRVGTFSKVVHNNHKKLQLSEVFVKSN